MSIRISRKQSPSAVGSFVLDYPEWNSPKRDGTRDRRTNNFNVIKHPSTLEIGRWRLKGKDPFLFYDVVNQLRAAGAVIAYCEEERHKRARFAARVQSHRQSASVDSIIAQFSTHPTDFESFCADLFRRLGYQAQTTPPTRDGGFDIHLQDENGITSIVECKCYDQNHHIGRPVVQKLRGANSIAHANGMMVVTTSSFSQDAINYAQQVGVQLIDGNQLVKLCQRVWGDTLPSSILPESACLLSRSDLLAHIPADMKGRY